jgi:pilus assembly protein Flp/PilA
MNGNTPDTQRDRRERGASLVEYALLLALIAIVCVVAVSAVGTNLSGSYDSTTDSMFGP